METNKTSQEILPESERILARQNKNGTTYRFNAALESSEKRVEFLEDEISVLQGEYLNIVERMVKAERLNTSHPSNELLSQLGEEQGLEGDELHLFWSGAKACKDWYKRR